jgi:hypothetical protein
MNPLDLLVAPVLFFSIWGGFRFFKRTSSTETKKPNIPKSSNVGVVPKNKQQVYPFQYHNDIVCPMCRRTLRLTEHKFCSCSDHITNHFHTTCKDNYGHGCGFKWIMKTAQ